MKTLDFDKSVSELVSENPDLKDIMAEAGFKDILNPVLLKTVGKKMTFVKGAKVKELDMHHIEEILAKYGYEAINAYPKVDGEQRKVEIKNLLKKLNQGVSMHDVQMEFMEKFSDVTYDEILEAEQSLIKDGIEVKEVMRLCDVHSVMFHDSIRSTDEALKEVKGHPLQIMKMENDEIDKLLISIKKIPFDREHVDEIKEALLKLKEIKKHYGKKEELYFRKLEKYGVSGPTTVMWGVDDEIYKNISALERTIDKDNMESLRDRLDTTLARAQEMIFKEEKILFPLAEEKFTDDDWQEVYRDSDEFGYCLISNVEKWDGYHGEKKMEMSSMDGVVKLPTGELRVNQLEAILRTMPIDVTFIDEKDIVRFFTNGENRIFPRPLSALGQEVYGCHAPKTVAIVKMVVEDFKSGKRDTYSRRIKNDKVDILVRYYAIRDLEGKYLGTLETSMNLGKLLEQSVD